MASSLLMLGTQCLAMEVHELNLEAHGDHQTPVEVNRWAQTIVTCIEKRKQVQLIELFKQPPQTRGNHHLNDKIFEEIKAHRDAQLDALRSPCSSKKIWNKIRAITIDIGLPTAALAVGLADGIIAKQPVIIALSTIYFVLSLESALKQTYSHWTMKEYEDKVEEFDVWLQVMQGMQQLTEKGEIDQLQPLIQHDNNKTK